MGRAADCSSNPGLGLSFSIAGRRSRATIALSQNPDRRSDVVSLGGCPRPSAGLPVDPRIHGFDREAQSHPGFQQAIRWNWPYNWPTYLVAGIALSFALQGIAHFLPIPKELPMDRFFRTPGEAWALSLFGVTFAPLLEELFFRGFLYPVLARRLGIAIAVLTTAAAFSLIHAPQLGRAWGPVLVIFMVGLALTVTRAVTRSVAASWIMHMAYNGTLSILLFAGTDGFRHLERLNQ